MWAARRAACVTLLKMCKHVCNTSRCLRMAGLSQPRLDEAHGDPEACYRPAVMMR